MAAGSGGPKLICSCYFSHNIFLHQYRQHVTFYNEKQFTKDFRAVSLNAVFSKLSSWIDMYQPNLLYRFWKRRGVIQTRSFRKPWPRYGTIMPRLKPEASWH